METQEIQALRAELARLDAEIGRMSRAIPIGQITVSPDRLPRWNALHHDRMVAERTLHDLLAPAREAARLERETAERARWAQEAERVRQLPRKELHGLYDIAQDGPIYILREVATGEEVYRGRLSRCREVAKE